MKNKSSVEIKFNEALQKQLPYATAKALTALGKDCADFSNKNMENVFDNPTPWTKKATGSTYATKNKPVTEIFIKDNQLNYLKYQIVGGVRYPIKKGIHTPVNIGLNKYGNLAKNALNKLRARKNTFFAVIKGIPGLWVRGSKNSVKLAVSFKKKVQYEATFPFGENVVEHAKKVWDKHFLENLKKALRTAK